MRDGLLRSRYVIDVAAFELAAAAARDFVFVADGESQPGSSASSLRVKAEDQTVSLERLPGRTSRRVHDNICAQAAGELHPAARGARGRNCGLSLIADGATQDAAFPTHLQPFRVGDGP